MGLFIKKGESSDGGKPEVSIADVSSMVPGDLTVHVMPERFLNVKPSGGGVSSKSNSKPKKKEFEPEKTPIAHKAPKKEKAKQEDSTKLSQPASKRGGVKRVLVIGVVVVIILGLIMAGGAYFFLRNVQDKQDPEDIVVVPDNNEEERNDQQLEQEKDTQDDSTDTQDDVVDNPVDDVPEDALLSDSDIDQDFLSEQEEILFGTDVNGSDTDDDSYLDGIEVLNLYDPRFGFAARLSDSNSVKMFVSDAGQYRMLIPTSWREEAFDDAVSHNRFLESDDDNADFIDIIVQPNEANYVDADAWYRAVNVDGNVVPPTSFSGQNIDGVLGGNGVSAYFVTKDYLYLVTYVSVLEGFRAYDTIFKMVLKSFTIAGE